jgi:hypothetical protein
MQELSINNQWLPSKVAIDNLAKTIIKPVMDGNADVIKSIATIRAVQEALDKVSETLKPLVVNELQKYSAKEKIISYGTEFTLKETGVKYDYSKCGDAVLLDLMKQVEELNTKIKERQAFLKSIKDVEFIVDTRTGELCEIHPPQKTSTTSYVITFAKEVDNG